MKIAVFGLGYVGCVTMVALASDGWEVIGVDVDHTKLDLLRRGQSPIKEPGLQERIRDLRAGGRLRVTGHSATAIESCDLALVSVGTPSAADDSPSLVALERVSESIGRQLRHRSRYLSIVFRSTLLPGTVEDHLIPLLEQVSRKRCGIDFGVGYNPEFMREGKGLSDFYHPARVVIGEVDRRTADRLEELYAQTDAPLVREPVRLTEMIKYADNAFHALKIGFANEIGSLAAGMGIDGKRLMEVFCLDTRLNLAPAYLRPGFAFGGSCLPKDVRALTSRLRDQGVSAPILESILPSNRAHLQRALELIASKRRGVVGIVGLTFKEDTDDLRESPALELACALRAAGIEVRVYDPYLQPDALMGANLQYLEGELPDVWELRVDTLERLLDAAATIVVTRSPSDSERRLLCRAGGSRQIIDLSGTLDAQ